MDAGNVDALLVASSYCLSEEEEIDLLRKTVELAAQRLGAEAFDELAGSFWGFLETRSYMRARGQLAEALLDAGRIDEAIAEWKEMLALNPNDNQGVRSGLLAACLTRQRLKDAARLFRKYDECSCNMVFAWGRVLEHLLSEDAAGAISA